MQGAGHRMWGPGCRVRGVEFRLWGTGHGVRGAGHEVQGVGCRVRGAGYGVQDAVCGVQDTGCGVRAPVLGPLCRGAPHLWDDHDTCVKAVERACGGCLMEAALGWPVGCPLTHPVGAAPLVTHPVGAFGRATSSLCFSFPRSREPLRGVY